ncbi:hypothetical protein CMESO_117 (nucleomorph) [Chroomonas mesostigmatica CCMP1168]|uniref:Uncharacterized protein n=1 Tax=Chroomonas mesostigmatica CCMP1168 TaxID=1195612 RepID=J7G7P3_9CRYP|nr:hypothetical protein CMESO_117 [Chroomonas mesostigmatica CCMP1168]
MFLDFVLRKIFIGIKKKCSVIHYYFYINLSGSLLIEFRKGYQKNDTKGIVVIVFKISINFF